MSNSDLKRAKKEKNDEFYTQLVDIENEMKYYKEHFRDKVIFCNCDDPEWSNFWKFFYLNFEYLGLKKLISTHYDKEKPTYKLECLIKDGKKEMVKTPLKQNGDFRSDECVEILKESDIVITNPPFSLFREYIAQLMEYDKKFLIIGHQNATSYKEIFKLIKENKIWLGYGFKGGAGHFINKHYEDYAAATSRKEGCIRVSGVHWFTNLSHKKRHEEIILYKNYTPEEYPKYDNYDAINVDKTKEIPMDYYEPMGVPITFMDKYNPSQFEIVGLGNSIENFTPNKIYKNPKMISKEGKISDNAAINRVLTINVKEAKGTKYKADGVDGFLIAPYARIIIKRKG